MGDSTGSDIDQEFEYCKMLEADLAAERSFRKVYTAFSILLFAYGLTYGSWLCPK
jgi:hypothetical protein